MNSSTLANELINNFCNASFGTAVRKLEMCELKVLNNNMCALPKNPTCNMSTYLCTYMRTYMQEDS